MRKLAFFLSVILFAVACSSNSNSNDVSGVAQDSQTAVINLMRDTVHYSYVPYEDPAAMMRDVDIALVGSVVSVDAALTAAPVEIGAVIVGLEPAEIWKDDRGRTGSVVYYYFNRPTDLAIERYREGLPVGSTVAMFGFDSAELVTFAEGDPGATTYTPAPQGLFMRSADERLLISVWGDNTWPEIRTLDDLKGALGS